MTISHIVLAAWRPDTPGSVLAELAERVGRFPFEIPGVVSVVAGQSVSVESLEGGFGWGMVVVFADAAARDAYLPHPAHGPVAELIGDWAERIVVFDIAG